MKLLPKPPDPWIDKEILLDSFNCEECNARIDYYRYFSLFVNMKISHTLCGCEEDLRSPPEEGAGWFVRCP